MSSVGHNLFRAGFTEFRHTGALSDVTVTVEGKRYRLHRLILAFSSEFFAALFQSEFKETISREVNIKFPDPRGVFPSVLKHMYGGRVDITPNNAIPLLQQTEQLLIPTLAQQCRAFIHQHLNSRTAFDILLDAIEFNQDSIVAACLKILASTFLHQADHNDWKKLDSQTFMQLLTHERLSVNDEWQLYTVVCKYVDAHQPNLSPEEVEQMMSTIRFRWLSYKQLQEVVANEQVPRALIIEALMNRLQTYESGIVPKMNEIPVRLRRRPICGSLFEYKATSSVDPASSPAAVSATNQGILPKGIVHWLATTFGRSPWKNPVSMGVMAVSASSLERGSLTNLLDEAPMELWTQNVPASYFCIDFVRYRVAPVAYALRHGHSHKRDYLRSWDIQGSNDGKIWTTLRRHSHDDNISGPFDAKVFAIDSPLANVPYQYFRIIQTGHNSSGNNFLVLSGFEIFGELWDAASSDELVAAAALTTPLPHFLTPNPQSTTTLVDAGTQQGSNQNNSTV